MRLRDDILRRMGRKNKTWTTGQLLGVLLDFYPELTRDELITTLEDLAVEGRVKQTWNDVWKLVA